MTEEQIIEIAEKIEEMYEYGDESDWVEVEKKLKTAKKVDKKKIINELNAAAERLQRKRHQSILDHGGHN